MCTFRPAKVHDLYVQFVLFGKAWPGEVAAAGDPRVVVARVLRQGRTKGEMVEFCVVRLPEHLTVRHLGDDDQKGSIGIVGAGEIFHNPDLFCVCPWDVIGNLDRLTNGGEVPGELPVHKLAKGSGIEPSALLRAGTRPNQNTGDRTEMSGYWWVSGVNGFLPGDSCSFFYIPADILRKNLMRRLSLKLLVFSHQA
jgi:hypothetical protein